MKHAACALHMHQTQRAREKIVQQQRSNFFRSRTHFSSSANCQEGSVRRGKIEINDEIFSLIFIHILSIVYCSKRKPIKYLNPLLLCRCSMWISVIEVHSMPRTQILTAAEPLVNLSLVEKWKRNETRKVGSFQQHKRKQERKSSKWASLRHIVLEGEHSSARRRRKSIRDFAPCTVNMMMRRSMRLGRLDTARGGERGDGNSLEH